MIEVRAELLCSYSHDPQAHFVVVRSIGSRTLRHPHGTKDEPLRFLNSREEIEPSERKRWSKDGLIRDFRIATSWACKKRWNCYEEGVYQSIICEFQSHVGVENILKELIIVSKISVWELSLTHAAEFRIGVEFHRRFLKCMAIITAPPGVSFDRKM